MGRRLSIMTLALCVAGITGCGGGASTTIPPSASDSANVFMRANTPKAVSPGTVVPSAMPRTALLSATAMTSRSPQSAINGLGFTQLPGGAQSITASPDGSIWVVSNVSSGNPLGNGIWHYANGTWTNIPGVATRLAAAPDGSIWAVNAQGSIYHYQGGTWTAVAGGASDLAVGSDNSLYVVSSVRGGQYGNAIYHYANGTWTQLPGAGLRIASSWDTGAYNYNVTPGGFYIVNAQLSLFYWNPRSGFTQMPGAAIQLAPTNRGGLFALGVPFSANGNPIYYNDLSTGTWTQEPGAGVAVAANRSAVYVIAANGGIYESPVAVSGWSPATAGDSLSYAGTLSTSIANNVISSSPVTTTQSAAVTQTIAVSAGSANQVVLTGNESDAFQLSTLTTQTTSTVAYQTSGSSTAVRLLQSSARDSNHASYQTQYTPTSGLVTVEPENAGTFGPNDASQTYAETDPGIDVGASGQNVTTTRTTAASGAYSETTNNADGSINKAVQNADGSGSYAIPSSFEGPVQLTFGLPTTSAPSTIPINVVASSRNLNETLQSPLWYPASPLALYAQTDTIAAASAYDPRCAVPVAYGTTSAKVTEATSSIDAVYGNLENQTTTTYDVAGVGTVCSIFTDTTQTFYDYTGQETNYITFNTTAVPILSSSITEVLSITPTVSGQTVSTASTKRAASSLSRLAVIVGRERFRHAVRKAKIAQAVRMATLLRRLRGVR